MNSCTNKLFLCATELCVRDKKQRHTSSRADLSPGCVFLPASGSSFLGNRRVSLVAALEDFCQDTYWTLLEMDEEERKKRGKYDCSRGCLSSGYCQRAGEYYSQGYHHA